LDKATVIGEAVDFAPTSVTPCAFRVMTAGGGPAGAMVSVRVALPVPPLLVALSVTVDVAAVVGVPEINPDVLLTDKPAGKPVAP